MTDSTAPATTPAALGGLSMDTVYELADRIDAVLQAHPVDRWWTPSQLGRKAKIPTWQAGIVLTWMDAAVFVRGEGNGAWRRFARRF